MLRGCVLVDRPVRSLRIVGILLERPPPQWNFHAVTKLIDSDCCGLMSREDGMQLKQRPPSKGTSLRNQILHKVNRSFLVAKNIYQGRRLNVSTLSLDQFLDKALRNERLRSTPVEVIDAFKDARFDAKGPDKPFVELSQASWV